MKEAKMWIAQNASGSVLIYHKEPIKNGDDYRPSSCLAYGYVGNSLLNEEELKLQPLECKITVIKPKENK